MAFKFDIRDRLEPGNIGELVHLHGILYRKEYCFDETFEAYVARGLADFVLSPANDKEKIWLSFDHGRIIGSIAIVRFSDDEAQLRWYLVHPDYRGIGLGRMLMEEAIGFCKECRYRKVFLWTTSELTDAARIYLKAGFVKEEEVRHVIWGGERVEEKYRLSIPDIN